MGIFQYRFTNPICGECDMVVPVSTKVVTSVVIKQIDDLLVRMTKRPDMATDSQNRVVWTVVKPGGSPIIQAAVHGTVVRHLEKLCIQRD